MNFRTNIETRADQDVLAFLELADELVTLAVEFHSAAHDIPEGIVTCVGMEIVFASVLDDPNHDFHEIAMTDDLVF